MNRYRRRSRPQYLMPFLVLVSVGVLLILGFQLWGTFFPNAKGDAVFYLAEGRSKALSFGTTEWENVYNGSKVKLGDSVKTLANAKGVMTFYDGTVVRMDENTQVTLVDISKKNDYQEILLFLNEGKIWVNKPKQNEVRKTDFVINTNWASYAITGTVFDLEKEAKETLRVLRGQVQVDIIESTDGKIHTIESMPVGIGQQSQLDEASMKAFYDRQSPSVLGAVDPIFQSTVWYVWNNTEDENPTNFAKGGTSTPVIIDNQATSEVNTNIPVVTSSLDPKDLSSLDAPVLIAPKQASLKTAKDQQTISGKAVDGVKKLILRQTVAGADKQEKILINSFDPAKLTWSYDLSEATGNIKAGINNYEFVGVDENAKETAPLKVTIEYQKSTDATEADAANNLVTLEKPKLLTVDGKSYKDGMNVTKSAFVITGSVKGADAMMVDDFKLSKFKTGDATWSYNINESFGNWKPGVNTYEVFGIDMGGKKSPIMTVKLNYDKPVVVTPVASTPVVTTSAVVPSTPVVSVPTPVTVVAPTTITTAEPVLKFGN